MDNNRVYVGIDPGLKGFAAVRWPDNHWGYFSVEDGSLSGLPGFLGDIKARCNNNMVVCVEEVHAILGASAKGTFNFGMTCGVIDGILMALGIAYSKVQPKTWQKLIWITKDMVYKPGGGDSKHRTPDTKKTSINAALRLFPEIDFRKNTRCKVVDDNKCDATLICEYARRLNL